jgi:hypothetical protein
MAAPRWSRLRLQSYGDDSASIKAFGLDVVTRLCEQLRGGGACPDCTSTRISAVKLGTLLAPECIRCLKQKAPLTGFSAVPQKLQD